MSDDDDRRAREWWALAERLCPNEYADLISANAHRNPSAKYAIKARDRAIEALIRAMQKKGHAKG